MRLLTLSFKLNLFLWFICIYCIPHNYAIPQVMPFAFLQVHSVNVIYCITCTLCKKICIGETGRGLADRFREQLRDVEKNDTDASKPVARHFNLPDHSHHNMTIYDLSLHRRNRKRIGGPLPRTATRCRKKRHRCVKTSGAPF